MKKIKQSTAMMVLLTFVSFATVAQKESGSPTDTSKNLTLKDKWTKHYNEINAQLDEYMAKLKPDGSDHPEFRAAINKLDKMLAAFKIEIDKWDNATKEQQAKYSDALKQDYKKLKAQEEKVKSMWDKINADMKKNSGGND